MKYDRIDPAEVQALNDEIARLKVESASAQVKQKEAESTTESTAERVCVLISPCYTSSNIGLFSWPQ